MARLQQTSRDAGDDGGHQDLHLQYDAMVVMW